MRIAIDITIPYRYRKNVAQHDYIEKTWAISKNKSVELQVSRFGNGYTILCFDLMLRIFQSHAGVMLELGMLNRVIILSFIDNRHWNYSEGRWCKPGEDE